MQRPKIESKLEDCPLSPGIYLMKDLNSKVIYVGKAKILKKRVTSYFRNFEEHDPKTQVLVSKIEDFEWIATGTELEALLLENTYIKKYKPRYNIRLRDDKSYPYIRIDMSHKFPRPYVARRPQRRDDEILFGPYTQASAVHEAIDLAAKVFLLRDCRDAEFANRSRPCLSYQIGQCTAPCVSYVDEKAYGEQLNDYLRFLKGEGSELEEQWKIKMEEASEKLDYELAAQFRDRIRALEVLRQPQNRVENVGDNLPRDVWATWPEVFKADLTHWDLVVLHFNEGKLVGRDHFPIELEERFLDSENPLINILFQYYAKKQLPSEVILPPNEEIPERAQLTESLVEAVKSDSSAEIHLASEKAVWGQLWELARDNAKLLSEEEDKRRSRYRDALLALQKLIEMPILPTRIDCVDVSNFQGAANVASCVVFENGVPNKEAYRHYKIQSVLGQDDFQSMKEIMIRRYAKGVENWPNLLVLDGGKGQLSSAVAVLKEIGCTFPVVALAKARTQSNFRSEDVESSEERIFFPGQKNPTKIKNKAALQLLTRIRDEAHRFAITFHRKVRDDSFYE
ncbi:MAG: excinuclease ABC subunit UvrC [Proteobacteria bacterium]|nr:excinuclease ABC subunit UvrC [Pseudomonadota bacterium]